METYKAHQSLDLIMLKQSIFLYHTNILSKKLVANPADVAPRKSSSREHVLQPIDVEELL